MTKQSTEDFDASIPFASVACCLDCWRVYNIRRGACPKCGSEVNQARVEIRNARAPLVCREIGCNTPDPHRPDECESLKEKP